ncbi:MAG TPA: PQQ-binding-like beta-propeller repeat protein [Thermoanaerobaculia bacterium]|nr:PQQ-binding-like beta-propeller repeat protein [Thermoanaerobaculia bacterium]
MNRATRRVPALLFGGWLAGFGGGDCLAQGGAEVGEWRHYGGDLGSTKYSPLDQIDATRFDRLVIAWRWASVDAWMSRTVAGGEWRAPSKVVFDDWKRDQPELWRGGLAPRISSLKVTPLMVDGVLYVVTPLYQAAAIDAATGETLWVYNPKSIESGTPAMSLLWNHRGAAYWSESGEDGKEFNGRIFWGTGDGWLIAVDAASGRPIDGFGDGGRLDLMHGVPRVRRGERDYLNALTYSCASPPIVVGDVVITGSSISDRRITKEAPPGDVRAFDVRTGELRWTFHTVPRKGEHGYDTWEDGSAEYSGNTNVWTMMSADAERGLVYLPIGTPTNDFYGGHRLGDNLYAESLVAVDARTGERAWHFQTVRHGLWDYDLPAAPNVVDIVVGGRKIEAVAQITKQGFVFVFDRATGEPVWPIEERAVPASDMPGERAAPTQPFPTRPPPFEAQGIREDDLIDFTPELRQEALEIARGYRLGPLYTPPSLSSEGGTQGTIQRPGLGGGANWWGGAVDPETGFLYVPSRDSMTVVVFYTPDPQEGGSVRYTHRSAGGVAGPRELPLLKPPYSRLTAIDLGRGEIAWMRPTGDGGDVRRHEALAQLDLPPLGGEGVTGPLVTRTLVLLGEAPGGRRGGRLGRLVARDKATGEVVGTVELPGTPIGTPMTYLHEGRQYIALTVSGSPPELVALALPESR